MPLKHYSEGKMLDYLTTKCLLSQGRRHLSGTQEAEGIVSDPGAKIFIDKKLAFPHPLLYTLCLLSV